MRTCTVLRLFLAIGFALAAIPSYAESSDQGDIDFANGLFQRGFYDDAAEQYRAYLKDYPAGQHRAVALYRLGESEYALGKYEAAFKALDDYLTIEGDGAARQRGQLRRGEALYRLERFPEAMAALEPLTADAVDAETRSEALYYLGKTYHEAGKVQSAIEAFKKVSEKAPENRFASFARYQLAFVYITLAQLEDAAVEFSAVASSNADPKLRMESRFRAAEAYDKLGWFDAAVVAYRQLEEEFPGSDYSERAVYGHTWALFHAGKFADALAAGDGFIQQHPDSPRAIGVRYLRGNCLQQQQQYDKALEIYGSIRNEYPESEFALLSFHKTAWVLYFQGNLDAAKTEVLAFLEKCSQPELMGEAAFLLGNIEAAQGNYGDAGEEFRLVAEKYPESKFGAEALYKNGECLAQLGRSEEAAKTFEVFAQKYPGNPLAEQAVLRSADAEFFRASFTEAVSKFKGILDANPTPNVKHETLYRLAITYHNIQDFKSSTETFQRIIGEFPDSVHTAEAHLRIGDYYLREQNDPVKALEEYQKSYDAAPKGPFAGRALKGLGLARYESKDLAGAAESFVNVMAAFPEVPLNQETYTWTGQWFFDQKQWDRSVVALESLLKTTPDYPNPERVRFKIAECRELAGDAANAIERYESVVSEAPASELAIEAKYRMAKLFEAQNKPEEAFRLYEEAANANTGDTAAQARFRLGELSEAKGDLPGAAKSYMRVAILFMHEQLSPESLWRAGQCFEKTGNSDRAKTTYQEVLDDYPNSEQAAKAKARLAELG